MELRRKLGENRPDAFNLFVRDCEVNKKSRRREENVRHVALVKFFVWFVGFRSSASRFYELNVFGPT